MKKSPARQDPLTNLLKTRALNVKKLMADFAGPAKLSKKLEFSSPSFLHAITAPHPRRTLSEKLARTWEQKLGLPAGWMDVSRED